MAESSSWSVEGERTLLERLFDVSVPLDGGIYCTSEGRRGRVPLRASAKRASGVAKRCVFQFQCIVGARGVWLCKG